MTDTENPLAEQAHFSKTGERLLFDNVPWKDWEVAGAAAVQECIDKDGLVINRGKSDLLRFLHLAISYRNAGKSGDSFTEEDVRLTVELLQKSEQWKEENRPTWTPQLRNAFKNMIFMLDGRDKRKRPVGVIRPLAEQRVVWATDFSDINKCVSALMDDQDGAIFRNYIPGVAEQVVFIIDLQAVGLTDLPSLVPSLKVTIAQQTANYTGRGGTYFVVNAGWTLSAAVNAVLMFAQEETRAKVQVFKGTLEGYAEENFDLEMLPKEWGGKAEMGCLDEIPAEGQEKATGT